MTDTAKELGYETRVIAPTHNLSFEMVLVDPTDEKHYAVVRDGLGFRPVEVGRVGGGSYFTIPDQEDDVEIIYPLHESTTADDVRRARYVIPSSGKAILSATLPKYHSEVMVVLDGLVVSRFTSLIEKIQNKVLKATITQAKNMEDIFGALISIQQFRDDCRRNIRKAVENEPLGIFGEEPFDGNLVELLVGAYKKTLASWRKGTDQKKETAAYIEKATDFESVLSLTDFIVPGPLTSKAEEEEDEEEKDEAPADE